MLVAVPSKGRPGRVKTRSVLPHCTLFVPQSEFDDYCRFYENVVPVPDDVRGITKTRNWILDNTDDEWVVMIDDDLKSQGFVELNHASAKHRSMNGDDWTSEFVKLFEMTEDLGYRIWGVATQAATRAVYPWSPIIFRSYVTASCMGILNRGIRFDESFPVKEDYEICLRCIKEDGGVVAARYIHWDNSHWSDDGGCKTYRTQQMEEECIDKLIALYPEQIRKVSRVGVNCCIQLEF